MAAPEDLATRTYELLLDPASWIHRRVESLTVLDETTMRWQVSLDATVPDGVSMDQEPGVAILPLAFLRRGVPLVAFDLWDEERRSLPLLTASQSAELSIAALTRLAYAERPDLMDFLVDEYIRQLVVSEVAEERDEAWLKIFMDGTQVGAHLEGRPKFVALARDLGERYVAYARVDATPGERRVLKFAMDRRLTASPLTFRASLGFRPVAYRVSTNAAGHASTSHFEVTAPQDMEFTYAVVAARGPEGRQVSGAPDVPRGRVHVYLRGVGRDAEATLLFGLRAERASLVRPATFVTLFTAAILTFIGARFEHFYEVVTLKTAHGVAPTGEPTRDAGGAVVALLATLPAIYAAYITRPGEHVLLARVLTGIRMVVLASAALSFFGGLILFAGYSYSSARTIWTIITVIAWLAVAAAVAANVFPRPQRIDSSTSSLPAASL